MGSKQAKMHVKKGDTVLVITGKDRGRTGKVIAAYPETERVLVEGVNRIKKHTKVVADASGCQDRRHRHAGGTDPRLQRAAGGRGRRQEGRHAHGCPHRRGRHQDAGREAHR